jgi:hypothetical protein
MKTNYLKVVIVGIAMVVVSNLKAQTTDNTKATLNKDSGDGISVKVVDNKGTIKYLQTNNGITSITSTSPGNKTTTTWQLGGTLTDNTYIDVNGNAFALNGIALVDLSTETASTNATSLSVSGNGVSSGWTLLVRDEATGETKKLLATDLVSGIRVEYTQSVDATSDVVIPVVGLPTLTASTTIAKLFVYRNGIKLRSDTDFVATANTITINYDATDMPMYNGDIVEIQYIK